MRGRYPDTVGPEVIREHMLGLADVAARAPLDAPVPSCPGWTLADLVWHQIEGGRFWAHVITARPAGPDTFEEPTRPPDGELIAGLRTAGVALADALTGLDPETEAWSWSDDRTVGFTMRRQSHEALIHHIDGRLAAGVELPPIPPHFAADGVDEMVGVMLTGVPDWATFEREPGVITLELRDTGDSWTLAFGRMIGTSPESGTEYDIDALEPVDEPADTVVSGDAADLHLWLNGRQGLAELTIVGDTGLAERLRTAAGTF